MAAKKALIVDSDGSPINVSIDDVLVVFNRLIAMMDSIATVDSNNRQRVSVDSLLDTNGLSINAASEESILLLRRMVKLLESQATVDASNRQRVVIDVIPTTAVTISSGTVSTVSAITSQPVDQRFEIMDRARTAYAVGIRNNITF